VKAGEDYQVFFPKNMFLQTIFIELFRLEKTFKISEFNYKPNTTKATTKPCPEGPRLHVSQTPPGTVTPPLPWVAWFPPPRMRNKDHHFFTKEFIQLYYFHYT